MRAQGILLLGLRAGPLDEINPVGVDDAVVVAADPEVVGDQLDGSLLRRGDPRLARTTEHGAVPTALPAIMIYHIDL